MKKCPFCAEDIQDAAIVCRYCSADLAKGLPAAQRMGATTIVVQKQLSPGVAAVLSLIIPGAGQMYCGHVAEGLFWLLFVVVGYAMLVLPGLALHIICIFGAITSANKANREIARSVAPAAKQQASSEVISPPPRESTRTEIAAGHMLAALANPRATFKSDRTGHKILIVAVYGLIGLFVLRRLLLSWLSMD